MSDDRRELLWIAQSPEFLDLERLSRRVTGALLTVFALVLGTFLRAVRLCAIFHGQVGRRRAHRRLRVAAGDDAPGLGPGVDLPVLL